MLALYYCLNSDSEKSMQAIQDDGGWQTGGLCPPWQRSHVT